MVNTRTDPVREGRWGIHQIDHKGKNTGAGTIGCGWMTRDEAVAANPPAYGYTFEPFERWGAITPL